MSSTSGHEPDEFEYQPTDESIDDDDLYNAPSFSVSKDNESPSLTSPPRTPISPLKRPRKSDADKHLVSFHKRLKRAYNDDYRKLYNEVVSDASARYVVEPQQPLRQSQIGGSIWTPREKAIFFDSVGKLGKDVLPQIAAAVKTKSEVEVRGYVLLLQDGLLERNVNDQRQTLLGPWDFPAALEVRQECEDRLEDAADALALQQGTWERKQEQEKYGEHWLLDGRVAAEVEELFDQGQEFGSEDEERYFGDSDSDDEHEATGGQSELEKSKGGILDTIPEAKLLKLLNWITLSENVFMNPSEERDMPNWQAVAETDKRPGLLHTSFADFHALTVSVTRRIVQASLFQAMTRLRATDFTGTQSKPAVRKGDICAVLSILGMQKNRRQYWVGVPRRCGLIVHRHSHVEKQAKKKYNARLSYDEVEAFLASKERLKDFVVAQEDHEQDQASPASAPADAGRDKRNDVADTESPADSAYEDNSEVEASIGSAASNVSSPPSSLLLDPSQSETGHAKPSKRQCRKKEQTTQDEEDYTERLDERDSLTEELRLWALLGHSPPSVTKARADAVVGKGLGKSPIPHRKTADEMVEWRDWIDYEAEWEHFGDFNYVEEDEHDADGGCSGRDEQTALGQESPLQARDDDNEEQASEDSDDQAVLVDDIAVGVEDEDLSEEEGEQSRSKESDDASGPAEEVSPNEDEALGVDAEQEAGFNPSRSGTPEPHSSPHRQPKMPQHTADNLQSSSAGTSDTDPGSDADASSSQ